MYNLTWEDIWLILLLTLTNEERECIWEAAENYSDVLYHQHPDRHAEAALVFPGG